VATRIGAASKETILEMLRDKDPGGINGIVLVDKPLPTPGPGKVLVRLKAATLSYRN
jgi:NADPH:quinone reductase-like Zn-dependent oxidoreductase